uniref:PID domain-containing protein n=1 Tax=Phasianus colchicus TaxID=9054 RepID=A0A669PLJ7_PHACC
MGYAVVSAGNSTAAGSTETTMRWGGSAGTSHRALPESWADMQEPLLEGMCFTLKYLGMTLVEKPKGEDMAAAAIRRIVATARVGARKFQKVILTVSPRGISLQDADTKEVVENISIYRISYCTTDKLQNKVFAYVAQSQESGALECHAFLSPKKKIVSKGGYEALSSSPSGKADPYFCAPSCIESQGMHVSSHCSPSTSTQQEVLLSQLLWDLLLGRAGPYEQTGRGLSLGLPHEHCTRCDKAWSTPLLGQCYCYGLRWRWK